MPFGWKQFFSGLLLLATLDVAPASALTNETSAHGEILWDTYGVPHIYGKDEAGGVLRLRLGPDPKPRQCRAPSLWRGARPGRGILGPEIRRLGPLGADQRRPRAGQTWYAQQTPQFRKDLDAFAAGINAYATANPTAMDPEERKVLPVSGVDVMAHAHRLMNYIYVTSLQGVMAAEDQGAGGSNAWAVAPSKSASGNTMLLANPAPALADQLFHLLRGRPERPRHPHVRRDPGRPAGAALCFNDRHGLHQHGQYHPGRHELRAEARRRRLPVRRQDAAVHDPADPLQDSAAGRVAEDRGSDHPLLRARTGVHPAKRQDWWRCASPASTGRADSSNTGTWARRRPSRSSWPILKRLQVPTFNIVYGDKEGHIQYLDNGILPKRAGGHFWRGLVPGDTSSDAVERRAELRRLAQGHRSTTPAGCRTPTIRPG